MSCIENDFVFVAHWGKFEEFWGHLLWVLVKIVIMFSLCCIIITRVPSARNDNKYSACIMLPNKMF